MGVLSFTILAIILSGKIQEYQSPESEPSRGVVVKKPVGRVIDMLYYIIPEQPKDSSQFYLGGYVRCAKISGSPWIKESDPEYVRGSFSKQSPVEKDEYGNAKFSYSKGRDGPFGYPCEYFETREGYDEYDEPVTKLFLKAEMMDWIGNSRYRAYHDGMNEPIFEWGRSKAVEGATYVQDVGIEIDYECRGSSSTVPIPIAVYSPFVFSLEGTLEEINSRLGALGAIEPNWIKIAKDAGSSEILAVVGYWGYRGFPIGTEIWKWDHREIYFYIHKRGLVGWRAQEHLPYNPMGDFVTHKEVNFDTVIWEPAGTGVRNLGLCESPQNNLRPQGVDVAIPPRFSISN